MKICIAVVAFCFFSSCAILPPPRIGATFLSDHPIDLSLSVGSIRCGNAQLPQPESLQATALVKALAEKNGFQIKEGSNSTVDLDYNEVDYDQDLIGVHSLTAFLTVKDSITQKTLATIFVSEDSQRTLNSWSVLYALVDSGFEKLRNERKLRSLRQ